MTTPEDKGSMCFYCQQVTFGEDHDQHHEKLNLPSGTTFKFTEKGMTVTATIVKKDTTREDYPDHYMCDIETVEIDGEDRTEEMLEKAFNGEDRRGIPLEKICETDIEVIEE